MKTTLAALFVLSIPSPALADDAPAPAPTESPAPAADPTSAVDVPLRPDDQNVDRTPFQYAVPPTLAAPAPAQVLAKSAPTPLSVTGSGYVAGYGYANHPTRGGGLQTQVRGDLWRGLDWGVHASYTVDVIEADDSMAGARTAHGFHDVEAGTSLGLGLSIPAWTFVEGHAMGGSTAYGTGMAVALGGGARVRGVDVEIMGGAILTSGDIGFTAALHVVHRHVLPAVGIGATLIYTHDSPSNMYVTTGGNHVAGGPEISFGPFGRARVVLDALFGDRAFALLSRGQIAENIPDVQHTTIRGFVWVDLTASLRAYLGGSYRTATAPVAANGVAGAQDYTLASGFSGVVYNF